LRAGASGAAAVGTPVRLGAVLESAW
jgi:hypothetical protein